MSDDDNLKRSRQAALNALHGPAKNYEALRQDKYEEQVVKFLLRRFDLLPWKRDLLALTRETEGASRLRLAAFNQIFNTFPVFLQARHIRKLTEKVLVRTLFANFSNLPFVSEYSEFHDSFRELARQDHKAVGLIFKWPYLPGGLVIHNIQIELDKTGTRMIRVCRREDGTVLRLVLEDLSSFCNALQGAWSIPER